MIKPKVWRFWVSTTSSVGKSKYINFVRESDYNKLLKEYNKVVAEKNDTMIITLS